MTGSANWATDVPLGPLTTYRVGGPARWFVTAEDVEDLLDVAARREGRDVLVIGRGSNLLVCDAGFDGIAIRLGEGFDVVGCRWSHVGPLRGGSPGSNGPSASPAPSAARCG